MICPKRLNDLLVQHVANFKVKEHSWVIGVSQIAGRGVFATRNIKAGEVIFRETALLIGPIARNETPLNVCTLCYKMLDAKKFLCKLGCGLPICEMCSRKMQHKKECQLFKSWEPIDPHIPNQSVIRMLTVARGIFFNKNQKDLLYAMQANIDTNFRNEVKQASACFKKFPDDKKIVEFLHRIVAVLNTNAYDATCSKDNHEYPLRALFPISGIVNHQCTPNSTFVFDEKNNTMTWKAATDIPEFGEITTSYTKILWSSLMRQLYLKMTKQFTCHCPRCSDPTENGTLLCALYCKEPNCEGVTVPENCTVMQPTWRCIQCKKQYKHSEMSKQQDFALGAVNSKLNSESVKANIAYINDKCPGFVPETNHIIVEAKLNIISRMNNKCKEKFTHEEYEDKVRYCDELLEILNKLGVGDSTVRTYLETEKLK